MHQIAFVMMDFMKPHLRPLFVHNAFLHVPLVQVKVLKPVLLAQQVYKGIWKEIPVYVMMDYLRKSMEPVNLAHHPVKLVVILVLNA